MNRRSFLRLIGGAGLGATLDRKYFFAPAAGWNRFAIGGDIPPSTPYLIGESGCEFHFHVDFPKRGSYPLEISDLGYYLLPGYPGPELTTKLRIVARGQVITPLEKDLCHSYDQRGSQRVTGT